MNTKQVKDLPAARCLLYADGIPESEMEKPFIAVVNSFNEVNPGHIHLQKLGAKVKEGIRLACGVPLEFHTIAVCDGIAMGHTGMKYSLPSRETIADSIEEMICGHGIFEGAVFIASCDKNLPGHLKAAARINLPSIFVTGGPMMPGQYGERRLGVKAAFEARSQFERNVISRAEYEELVKRTCPGAGSCSGLYTANSMACVTEALGLSLKYCATVHALDPVKEDLAFTSGQQIMQLVQTGQRVSDIVTPKTIENALRVDMAIGASTNTLLHVPDFAAELGYAFDLNEIERLNSTTPNLARLNPATELYMIDLHHAGGIPAVMGELQKNQLLSNTSTIDGKLFDRIAGEHTKDATVIRPIENPYSTTGGLAVLYGNLAEEGAVIKEAAVSPNFPRVFCGKALVFDSEEATNKYFAAQEVAKGSVIVIRYEGKVGGPGMREMLYPTSAISGLGLDEDVALITDGRFSGASKGPCIGHIQPEAALGGNIALVKNGDPIQIDLDNRRIDLLIEKSELDRRRTKLQIHLTSLPQGVLKNYRRMFNIGCRK
jgi:dihydroxy-acid dehydratase